MRVFYNSDEPRRFHALAFTEGNRIFMGPGQERHLGHEVWHAVQQKQGRVRAKEVYEGVNANFDKTLEDEAERFEQSSFRLAPVSRHLLLKKGERPKAQFLLADVRRVVPGIPVGGGIMGNARVPRNDMNVYRGQTLLSAHLQIGAVNIDIGNTWSQGGVHAEEAICNHLSAIENHIAAGGAPIAGGLDGQIYAALTAAAPPPGAVKTLSLVISSSPCTSNAAYTAGIPLGQITRPLGVGCTENLIALHNNFHYGLHIVANNLYTANGVGGRGSILAQRQVSRNALNAIAALPNCAVIVQDEIPLFGFPILNFNLNVRLIMAGGTVRQFKPVGSFFETERESTGPSGKGRKRNVQGKKLPKKRMMIHN